MPAQALPLSTLAPAGPGSQDISLIWWAMFAGSIAIYVLVLALWGYAMLRRRRDGTAPAGMLIVGGGLLLPVVVISCLMVAGIRTGQALLPLPAESAYRVEVSAHRWWWEAHYPDARPARTDTVNELHIPAGLPVHVYLTSTDVIHSFWVPRLGGKMDAIPGRTTVLRIQADKPGAYHGLCAEFCGTGHAHMPIVVHAHATDSPGATGGQQP